jgi:hypothetical protein
MVPRTQPAYLPAPVHPSWLIPRRLIVLSFGIVLLCSSCSQRDNRQFKRPAEARDIISFLAPERALVDSMALPGYLDGGDACLVTSRDTSGDDIPGLEGLFDRLELYSFTQSTGMFRPVFEDPVDRGQEVRIMDITGDKRGEVIVKTLSRINDPEAMYGLAVYGRSKSSPFTPLFLCTDGNPEIIPPRGSSQAMIRVFGRLDKLQTGVNPVIITRGIYTFDGNSFARSAQLSDREVELGMERYRKKWLTAIAMKPDTTGREINALYEAAAGMLVQAEMHSQKSKRQAIWTEIEQILKQRLPDYMVLELETLALEDTVQPISKQTNSDKAR